MAWDRLVFVLEAQGLKQLHQVAIGISNLVSTLGGHGGYSMGGGKKVSV